MSDSVYTAIERKALDLNQAMAFVSAPNYGAISLFSGTVRNHHDGHQVTGINYDGHPRLAEQTLRAIATETATAWPDTSIYVSHYLGELTPGDISVIIAIGAPHREAGFAACRYIIEQIKQRVPIWKQEHYADGRSEWLPGQPLNGHS